MIGQFFRDIYLVSNGSNYEDLRQERLDLLDKKRRQTFFLSRSTKNVIRILEVLFIPMVVISLMDMYAKSDYWGMVGIVLVMLLAAASFVCISIKAKKTEIIGTILFGIFFLSIFLKVYQI